jgi:hypothetical protein
MAQTGYTPILIYSSSTAAAAPLAGNLTNSTLGSELAINITDGKLFYKDNANAVQVIGWKVVPTSAGGTGLSGATPFTANGILFASSASALNTSSALTWNGSTLATTGALTVDGNATLGNASTDTVQVNGYMGVGGAAASNVGIFARNTALTSTGQYGMLSDITSTSAATNFVAGLWSRIQTPAETFTLNGAYGLIIQNAVKGAGSTITNQFGIQIADQTQGTNNFGISSLVSSGTNKWNIYASGTAANYFAGQSQFANGAVGTPSISNINDTNTGIFFPAADTIAFVEGGTEVMRLFSSAGVSIGDTTDPGTGNLRLGTGNLVIGTSGKGIDFSATPGTGTSELLADYEEGTWTPVPNPSSGAYTTYTSKGRYTKVGNLVCLTFQIVISNRGTATTMASITGLPFAADANSQGSGAMRERVNTGLTWSMTIIENTSAIDTFVYDNTTTVNNGATFNASIVYRAA